MLRHRFRKKEKKGGFLPILIPVMNLFLLTLPLVIQNAYLQKLTTVEMQLPSITESGGAAGAGNRITIDIGPSSLTVLVNDSVHLELPAMPGFEARLASTLRELKQRQPTKRDIVLKVAPLTRYELVVAVMDECKGDGLFPDVVYLDEVR